MVSRYSIVALAKGERRRQRRSLRRHACKLGSGAARTAAGTGAEAGGKNAAASYLIAPFWCQNEAVPNVCVLAHEGTPA